MTVSRDVETRQRHQCTGWLSVRGIIFQCDSGFGNTHAGPHFHTERDDTGMMLRMTWQNSESAPPVPPT